MTNDRGSEAEMTPDEQRLVMKLVIYPNRPRELQPAEFLARVGAGDGVELSLRVLQDAVDRRDSTDVEMGMILTAVFGVSDEHLPVLLTLAAADWHCMHEDVVSNLGDLRRPESIDALFAATQWVPSYLDFDENRALATKAVRAIATIPGQRAEEALVQLSKSEIEPIREVALRRLERRRAG